MLPILRHVFFVNLEELVVSNLGDSGEMHARVRKWAPARRRSAPPLVARLLAGAHFRARAYISPASPKLETARSLRKTEKRLTQMVIQDGGRFEHIAFYVNPRSSLRDI